MFKSSRQKIVAAIMSILVFLFLGTLAIIYGSSYYKVSTSNHEMLKRYAELYSLENQPGDDALPGDTEPPGPDSLPPDARADSPKDLPMEALEDTSAFLLSTFYSVAISDDGEILAVDNGNGVLYEDSKLEAYAVEILESGKKKGTMENLIYLSDTKDGYSLISFMDNTILQDSMTMLFRYTFVFGSLAIAALFLVAVYLARRIVRPLEESYQKQKQFISDAGHELKTPVAVISTNAELLAGEIGRNQWLSNIRYENERMCILVGRLLELAHTETDAPQTGRLDLSRLVTGEALPFESVAFEQGIALNCAVADGIFIDGNSNQLKQLVSILLDNAICHGSGREIDLLLKEERNSARLSVINDGEEIPPEQRELLFERFYRTDAARGGEDSHYGLGLAIARAVTAAHKGKIEVECYNGRIEFTVRFPLRK